uniref:Uncharacterized protein n=1 Tax=Amblyomma triste TaxID=251400 RepID=A0A023G3S8_AMBTT
MKCTHKLFLSFFFCLHCDCAIFLFLDSFYLQSREIPSYLIHVFGLQKTKKENLTVLIPMYKWLLCWSRFCIALILCSEHALPFVLNFSRIIQ